jgi:hypothetical protein
MHIAQSAKQECLKLVAERSRSLYEGKKPSRGNQGFDIKLQKVDNRSRECTKRPSIMDIYN